MACWGKLEYVFDIYNLRWIESEKYKGVADKWFGISEQLEGKLRNNEVLTVDERRQLEDNVVEAMSTLFRSGMVSDAMTPEGNLPGWMRPVISACAEASTHAPEYAVIGDALRELEEEARTTTDGAKRYQETVNKLMANNRDVLERMFKEYREDPTAEQIARMEGEVKRAQDEQDARVGRGVSIAPEETERGLADFEAEEQREAEAQAAEEAAAQEDENEAREDIKSKPGNEGMSEEEVTRERAERYAEAQEDRTAQDPAAQEDKEGIFAGGKYTLVQAEGYGDVKAGMVPVGRIRLDADGGLRGVRYGDFRVGGNAYYRPDHEPIYLWQRGSGELVVIDGHNRLMRAKLAGAESINAYVFTETEERNEQWARAKYYEKNVRERRASVREVAWFVSGANMQGRQLTNEELAEYGLHEGQSNKVRFGIMLGRYGAPEVLDALFDRPGEYEFEEDVLGRGGISLADAVRIVEFAKGDRDVQLEGLRALRGEADENGAYGQGRNIEAARRVMQLFLESKGRMSEVGEVEAERERHFLRWLADYQGRKLRELAGDVALLREKGATKELMEKYGVEHQKGEKEQAAANKIKNAINRMRNKLWTSPEYTEEAKREAREEYEREQGGREGFKKRWVAKKLDDEAEKRKAAEGERWAQVARKHQIPTPKDKRAGRMAALHEFLEEMRKKYAGKGTAYKKVYDGLYGEKNSEKREAAKEKLEKIGKPILDEAKARGFSWNREDLIMSLYLGGAVFYPARRHVFEESLLEMDDNYTGKNFARKKKHNEEYFKNWLLDVLDKETKRWKGKHTTLEEKVIDEAYRYELQDREYAITKRKANELRADEDLMALGGVTKELADKYGVKWEADGEEGNAPEERLRKRIEEQTESNKNIGDRLETRYGRNQLESIYESETGGQMWLNEEVEWGAGHEIKKRNVHFSTEERPNLRRCKALDGEGKELEKDRFISTPLGNLNWFEFPKDEHTQEVLRKKGIKDLPIRLKVGKHEAEHRGYGWMHVLNHYEDMQAVGESPLLFLYNTLTNLAQMDAQGGARYRFGARNNGSNSALVVDLMEDEGCYSIVTCFPTYNARQYEGSGLLVGRALFRLSGSSDQTRLEARHQTNEAATGTANTIGKAKTEDNLTQEGRAVNIYDVNVVDEKGRLVYRQQQEPRAHFSVDEAREMGMFKDERLEVSNGVIAEHGAHFSVDFSHVSPALYRRPDKEHVGTGEGNAVYGWGVLYGATNPVVNRSYHKQFTRWGSFFVHGLTGERLKKEDVLAGLRGHGVWRKQNLDQADAWVHVPSKGALMGAMEEAEEEVRNWETWVRIAEERKDELMKMKAVDQLEYWKQERLVADYFIKNDILVKQGVEMYPVNYRMRADVDDSNLLHWDEDAADFWKAHPEILRAISEEFGAPSEEYVYSGESIYKYLVDGMYRRDKNKPDEERVDARRAASEWLDAHGIRGVKYADGMTRYKENKTYNYVIFNPDYIKVIAINNRHPWSEYSKDNPDWERPEDVFGESSMSGRLGWLRAGLSRFLGGGTRRVHFSLGGERAATYGEMEAAGLAYYDPADGRRKFALPTAGVRLRGGFTPGELNVGKGGHKDVSLAALLHYPELFRAYPELGRMRVRLYREEGSGVGGFYAPGGILPKEGSYIALNMGYGTDPGRILDTLLHESQHAIQSHEGWAMGYGGMSREQALEYLGRAIELRKKLGTRTPWGHANMRLLKEMVKQVRKAEEGDELRHWLSEVYWMSHGEQEARYAGERRTDVNGEGVPRVSGVAEGYDTIAVLPERITELGGITFGNAGVYARLMESRLAPVGDFQTDRRLYQIRESAVRYARLLNGFTREGDKSGESLLLEAQGVAERAVSLLPNEYRVGLEPYRVWLSVFAEMSKGGFEAAERASAMVPMRGWGDRIYRSIGKQIYSVFSGRVPEREMEFWLEREESRKLFEQAREMYNEAKEKAKATGAVGQSLYELTEVYLRNDARYHGVVEQLIGELGKVKTEKVLAKLLERVKHQLDAYRKDKTLGAMRKAVAAAYPAPGKGGQAGEGADECGRVPGAGGLYGAAGADGGGAGAVREGEVHGRGEGEGVGRPGGGGFGDGGCVERGRGEAGDNLHEDGV